MKLFRKKAKTDFKVIGVTGSYGKTSVLQILHSIFRHHGHNVGFINSYGYGTKEDEINTSINSHNLTSKNLKNLLKKFSYQGIEFLVLEMDTSLLGKAVFDDISLDSGVITNAVEEDNNKTIWEDLLKAKLKFSSLLKDESLLVLNSKSTSLIEWLNSKEFQVRNNIYTKLISDKNVSSVRMFLDGVSYVYQDQKFISRISGSHSLENQLLAISLLERYVDKLLIKNYLEKQVSTKGVFELYSKTPHITIIDRVKNSNQLYSSLYYIKSKVSPNSRIITVLGVDEGYEHEASKLGSVAARFSDVLLATASNPGAKSLEELNREILRGATLSGGSLLGEFRHTSDLASVDFDHVSGKISSYAAKNEPSVFVFNQNDYNSRLDSIKFAYRIASPGDVIFLANKGAEDSINFNGVIYEWSDHEAIELASS